MDEYFVGVDEAARLLGATEQEVLAAIGKGELAAMQWRGSLYVKRDAIAAYIASRATDARGYRTIREGQA